MDNGLSWPRREQECAISCEPVRAPAGFVECDATGGRPLHTEADIHRWAGARGKSARGESDVHVTLSTRLSLQLSTIAHVHPRAGFTLPDTYQAPELGRVRRPGSGVVEDIPTGEPEEVPYYADEE